MFTRHNYFWLDIVFFLQVPVKINISIIFLNSSQVTVFGGTNYDKNDVKFGSKLLRIKQMLV